MGKSERMGKSVSVPIKMPCCHKLVWLGTKFRIAAFAFVYSSGIDGELSAIMVPGSFADSEHHMLDETSKKEMEEFKREVNS